MKEARNPELAALCVCVCVSERDRQKGRNGLV